MPVHNKQYDYVVFLGRFQPFHIAHLNVIKEALKIGNKVIIGVGSSFQPRTPKNPWTFQERWHMINNALKLVDMRLVQSNTAIVPIRDYAYNDQQWTTCVQEAVNEVILRDGWTDKPPSVALIGHFKDDSSYYLNLFPQWPLFEHDMNEEVNATDLRQLYFEEMNIKYLHTLVPDTVFDYLQDFKSTDEFKLLVEEYNCIKDYKKSWQVAPYPPTFVTVDACVVQSGHILLVERKASPGRGLFALPGGFVEQDERLEDALLRELREETRLKVPDPVIRGNIKHMHVFDAPGRSLRGRTITTAYYVELPPGVLPKVKGGDDAKKAFWMPISEIRSEQLFEDHHDIINFFVV